MNPRLLMLGLVLATPVFGEFLPPPGPVPSEEDRKQLQAGVDELGKQIESLRKDLKDRANLLELLPDVEIFHKAVRFLLEYGGLCDCANGRRAAGDGGEQAGA